jgi:CubicO group peptidase (beta-lactamase class C family)
VNRSTAAGLVALATLVPSVSAQDAPPPAPLGIPTGVTAWTSDATRAEGLARPEIDAESVAAFFDAAFELQRLEHRMVGAVVSVVYDGEVLFKRGYGWADLEARLPADPDESLFRIASITKTFVWTALMQLVEQGSVALDADVNRYLDFEIPATYDEPVRVWHLMSHTAGFEETWTGWGARDPDDVHELGRALAELMPARVRPPGEHAAYSNYGAALAGYIVQRVSGEHWAEYTERQILDPLGMHSTNARVPMSPELRERHARGYLFQNGRFVPTDLRYFHLTPAGVMSSTAADMATFMLAHLNRGAVGETRILEERTATLMQSPLFQPHDELLPILHGFYRSDRNGQTVFGHGGDTNQFHSNMSLLPEVGLGVFVSYNSDPAAAARSNVIAAFLDHFFPAEYLRPGPDPADVDLSDYAGEYIPLRSAFSTFERIRSVFNVGSVTTDGAMLSINGSARWIPTGRDRFTGLYGDAVIVFERDEKGDVSHMIAGSPLSTLKRARGLEGRIVQPFALFVVLVSFAAVLAWVYRLLRPIPEPKRLPSPHVRLAWVHALCMGTFLLAFVGLAGNTVYGIPFQLHLLLLAFNANMLLGLLVIAFSVTQWLGRHGTLIGRTGYTLVALAAATNIWLGWSYNLVGYLF